MHTQINSGDFFLLVSAMVKVVNEIVLKFIPNKWQKNPVTNELNYVIPLPWESPFWKGIFPVRETAPSANGAQTCSPSRQEVSVAGHFACITTQMLGIVLALQHQQEA